MGEYLIQCPACDNASPVHHWTFVLERICTISEIGTFDFNGIYDVARCPICEEEHRIDLKLSNVNQCDLDDLKNSIENISIPPESKRICCSKCRQWECAYYLELVIFNNRTNSQMISRFGDLMSSDMTDMVDGDLVSVAGFRCRCGNQTHIQPFDIRLPIKDSDTKMLIVTKLRQNLGMPTLVVDKTSYLELLEEVQYSAYLMFDANRNLLMNIEKVVESDYKLPVCNKYGTVTLTPSNGEFIPLDKDVVHRIEEIISRRKGSVRWVLVRPQESNILGRNKTNIKDLNKYLTH